MTNPYSSGELSGFFVIQNVSLSTDGTFADNSDALIPTQKAIKTYLDANYLMVADLVSYFEENYIIPQTGVSTSAPGVNNDGVDTADFGMSFNPGDFWLDTSTGIVYCCKSNTTGAAVWTTLLNPSYIADFPQVATDTSAPTSDNDDIDTASFGMVFKVGDIWLDTSSSALYYCQDNTSTSANWVQILDSSDVVDFPKIATDASDPDATNDDSDTAGFGMSFDTGDFWLNTSSGELFYCTDNSTSSATWQSVPQSSSSSTELNVLSKTSDYTIQDSDLTDYGKLLILADSRTGTVEITFPTAADNEDKIIRVQVVYLGGPVEINGEGSETFNVKGTSTATLRLMSSGDYLEAISNGSEWQILGLSSWFCTGVVANSDWTNRHLGSICIDFDNLSGSFTEGEVITESTSGNTGIIVIVSAPTMVLKDVVGGKFTNNYTITGAQSGATADVNGNTKNVDRNLAHYIGVSLEHLDVKIYYDSSTSYSSTHHLRLSQGCFKDGTSEYGWEVSGIGSCAALIQTGANGVLGLTSAGEQQIIDNEDYVYKIFIGIKI